MELLRAKNRAQDDTYHLVSVVWPRDKPAVTQKIRFARAPRQYRINPNRIEASVPPSRRNSKLHLLTVSPGGTSETKIPITTTTKPTSPQVHKPSLPPGMSMA